MAVSESYLKVPYDIRQSKQIERRMIIESLVRLAEGGFRISNYKYTGFGSIFFVDFVLLRKYLGITKMVSIEYSNAIRDRVEFNKPLGQIEILHGPAADFIPHLDADTTHILWLDYDNLISKDIISDVRSAATTLCTGSVLLITVDIESPAKKPQERQEFFEEIAGEFFDSAPVALSSLAEVNIDIIRNAVKNGISGRADVVFKQLYNFVYADGHNMLTFGGMICGNSERKQLDACDFDNANYLRTDSEQEPFKIEPPVLTRKERMYLDARMPCNKGWTPDVFELAESSVAHYSELYPYFPSYVEALL